MDINTFGGPKQGLSQRSLRRYKEEADDRNDDEGQVLDTVATPLMGDPPLILARDS